MLARGLQPPRHRLARRGQLAATAVQQALERQASSRRLPLGRKARRKAQTKAQTKARTKAQTKARELGSD